MTEPAANPLEAILRHCAAAAPEPWYPSRHAATQGVARDSLDTPLDRLRVAGLIRLTDWVKDLGQGYVLTPEGEQVLASQRYLGQLNNGTVPSLAAKEPMAWHATPGGVFERGEAARTAVLVPGNPVVTKVLIGLNVGVFVVGVLLSRGAHETSRVEGIIYGSPPAAVMQTMGLWGFNLLQGQWWRLLTTCFVHAGLLHLAGNMFALYTLGPWGERLWGSFRFLVLYLLSGFLGSCTAMALSPNGVVGASGAICGLLGAQAAWLYLNRSHLPPPFVAQWAQMLAVNAGLIVFISFGFRGISAAAHFGGAGAGVVAAFLLTFQRFGTRGQSLLALVGLLALPIAGVGVVLRAMDQQDAWAKYAVGARGESLRADYLVPIKDSMDRVQELVLPIVNGTREKSDAAETSRIVAALAEERLHLQTAQRRLETWQTGDQASLERLRLLASRYADHGIAMCDVATELLEGAGDGASKRAALTDRFMRVHETGGELAAAWQQFRDR